MGMRILVELFWPQRRHLARVFGFLDRHLDMLMSVTWPAWLLRFARGPVVSSRYLPCLGRAISCSKALVSALSCSLTLIHRLFSLFVCLRKVIRSCAMEFPVT